MEEPRGTPRLARRRDEAERPRDAVRAAFHLAAADVVAQLTAPTRIAKRPGEPA